MNETAREIIERLGGTRPVAAALGVPPSTVQSWKTANRIPRWRELALRSIFGERL